MKHFLAVAMLAGTALAGTAGHAQEVRLPAPDPRASVNLNFENDAMGSQRSDRWYTSGQRLGFASPEGALPAPFGWLDGAMASLLGPANSRWTASVGQQIFTPNDLLRNPPDSRDRPYAGYLYLELGLNRRTENTLDRFTLQAGMVGPSSLAKESQEWVHGLTAGRIPRGWHSQIPDEAVFNLGWQRIWRQRLLALPGGLETDVLPALELAAGTVAVYAQAGARFRIGQGLERDFGPGRIRPGGPDGAPPVGDGFGWYLFAGASGRVVGRDIFLDGSTWRRHSPSIDRNLGVADFEAGAALLWNGIRLSFTQDWRTEEYKRQPKWFNYGIFHLTVGF